MLAPYTPFYCEENVYQLLSVLSSASATHSRFSRLYAAFVSNLSRRAVLFQQKASRAGVDQGSYVIWDYHVVAVGVLNSEAGEEVRVVVLDRDSRLGEEVELADYVLNTFRPDLFAEDFLDPSLESRLRVVPAANFLANFASDRSHMLLPPSTALDAPLLPSSSLASATPTAASPPPQPSPPPPTYIQPPPPYPPLQGAGAKQRGETDNLWTRWLDVRLPAEEEEGSATGEKEDEKEGFGVVLEAPADLLRYKW
ncbi:hypothetical protein JCM6882_008743 [Rhodosporidiobolus microsporus]